MLTIESLMKELGDGVIYIMGITTDAFGAAVEEGILVLKHIDKIAMKMSAEVPGVLRRDSTAIPGQSYDYGGRFRELCIRTCQMHNFERILSLIINMLMGNQGLAHDMTPAQNLYRYNYYMKKLKPFVDTLIVIAMGGDPDD